MPNGKFEELKLYPPPESDEYDDQSDYMQHGMDWLMHTVYFLADRQHTLFENGCEHGAENEKKIEKLGEIAKENQEVARKVREDQIGDSRIDKLWNSIGSYMKVASALFGTLAAISFIVYNLYFIIKAGS